MSEITIPAEVFAGLPHIENTEGLQYHAIDGSPGSSHGETHLVAMEGAWYIFHRKNRSDSLTMAVLEDSEMPRVKNDPFGASLLLRFDGQPAEVQIPLNPGELNAVNDCINHSWPKEVGAPVLEPETLGDVSEEKSSRSVFNKAKNMVKKASDRTRALATDPMAATVDQALDLIEFVAVRAAKRGTLSHLRVEANLNLGVAQVAIEVGYGTEELQELVELKTT